MTLLLDQGLPRSAVARLKEKGLTSVHVAEIGMESASDDAILAYGRERGWTVVTLDADFHTLLALSGTAQPSVIRIRMEGLRAENLANLLADVIHACSGELEQGAMVSVTETNMRIRRLPLLESRR
jgi:predicted nuclease of predicted toxin-antitoxin system